MSVVVSLQEVGPCRKQLKIEVPAPAVEAETQRVVKEYGQSVRIPGFRKGKVPAELVRRRFAKDIEKEVVERLMPRYWRQAQAESEIDPLLPPEVDEVGEMTAGSPWTFVATVETRPAIELGDLQSFNLPDPEIDPGTLEVDEAIDELRKRYGDWVPVERPAARGDLVTAGISELTGETEGAIDVAEVEVGQPQVWPELSEALRGLSAGEEAVFTRHDGEGETAGPERRFRVRVNAVKERELPALDDEFAARVSPDFKTVDALQEAVTSRLRQAKREQRDEQRNRALLDQLRERHPMELPQGVVGREVEGLVHDYAENLARRGVNLERSGIDWSKVGEEMRPLAERRVHARLLLDAIAEAESIQVADDEFERTLSALARAQGTTSPALRKSLDESGRLSGLRSQLRRDKTIRHLLGEPIDAHGGHDHEHHHHDHSHDHAHSDV
jgi:trigger factor